MNPVNRWLFSAALVLVTACGGSGSSTDPEPIVPDNGSSSSSSSSSADIYPDYNSNPPPPDDSGMARTAPELAEGMGLGWNIGNTLEAIGGETAWGNPMVTEELIQLVKDSGFNAIRIPAAWDQYADQETAEIDRVWLDRVKQVVEYSIERDLYVIVNIHWDGGWLEDSIGSEVRAGINAKQRAYWQQIATHLRDFDERLLFAGTNEPHVENAEQMEVLMSYLQTFVSTVRETGGRNAYRTLVVQGPVTDIERTQELWTHMPEDTLADRLMMEVHFYTPYNFALMTEDQSWGNRYFYWGDGYHSSTDTEYNAQLWAEEALIDDLMASMKHQFVDQGIPVVLGEYGAIRRSELTGEDLELHLASRAYYIQYVTEQAIANGLLPFYWDNGGTGNHAFALFDRDDNSVYDQQLLDALNAALETSTAD